MSFSKAKLHRFNDVQEPTPSPADYNPKIQDRVGGIIISQTERFADQQRSPSQSDIFPIRSANSSTCFRTPTVSVKKKLINTPGNGKKRERTNLFSTPRDVEALQEKIVECNNKDLYINELIEQREEIKLQITNLQNHNELLLNEVKICECKTEHLVKDYTSKLETMVKEHNNKIEQLKNVEIDLLETITCLQKELQMEKNNCAHTHIDILNFREQCNDDAVRVMEIEQKCKDIESSWQMKLEKQEKEAEEILKECQAISEYNIIECEVQKNAIVHQLCQATMQLELEKQKTEEMLCDKNRLECEYQNLKVEFDQILSALNSTSEQLKHEKENQITCLQQTEADIHAYEVTINKTRETVEALKKRLFDSDRDVEQLKSELENTERMKLEFEARSNSLSDELGSVKKNNEDLELQNESTIKITEDKIKIIQNELSRKVDAYKRIAEESVRKANDKLDQKCIELTDVMEQLHCQQVLNSKAQALIEKAHKEIENLEMSNEDYKVSLTILQGEMQSIREANENFQKELKALQLRYEHSKLQNTEVEVLFKQYNQLQEKSDSYYHHCEYYKNKVEDYEKEIEEIETINKKYIDQSGKYDSLLQKYEELITNNSKLQKMVNEQESLIGPFRMQLEAYEFEFDALKNQKCHAESEAKAIGMKYAELMSHQNQKQKIKHVMDLKTKNNELNEANEKLQVKSQAQQKIIEKLKKEITLLKSSPKKNAGKENRQRSALNLNLTLSPLRERN